VCELKERSKSSIVWMCFKHSTVKLLSLCVETGQKRVREGVERVSGKRVGRKEGKRMVEERVTVQEESGRMLCSGAHAPPPCNLCNTIVTLK
jgi:hypothetical protein